MTTFLRSLACPLLVLALACGDSGEPAGEGAAGGQAGAAGPGGGAGQGGGASGSSGQSGAAGSGDLRPDWRARAGRYLEARSDAWIEAPPATGNVRCAMSCHTTFPYALARHALADALPTPVASKARERFVERLELGDDATPFYGHDGDAKARESAATEAVLNAAALAVDEVWSGQPLSTPARAALDRMWSRQLPDGTWPWLEFGLEPWETRTDFGVVTALLAAGVVPGEASGGQAAAVARAVDRARARLDAMVPHDRVALLWVDGLRPGTLTPAQRAAIADEIAARQLPDGGFSAGGWDRGALAASVAAQADGYATALSALALCPEAARQDATDRALAWLASHQRDDGSWAGQSVNRASELNRTFMTDAATAYAVLALTRCGGR